MILEVLAWLALADAVAGLFLAVLVHVVARRSGHRISLGRTTVIAILFGLPAGLPYCVAAFWIRPM